ncbi:MAG: hypothetical protein HZA51_05585 [Planctomycetes bacterium]|nr:hypothetical protein [Planctomycetota bacterium]
MQGYILSVRPHRGEATIISETGQAFCVRDESAATTLHGGDIVRFQLDTTNDRSGIMDLEVVAPWPERFAREQSNLLREFCEAMKSLGV